MANSDNATLGFRIVGDCTGERRLVDWQAAFTAHSQCDARAEVHREAYLSAFEFTGEFAAHLTDQHTTKGYAGRCGARWLWFDIDADGDLEHATTQARRLCAGMVERYGIDADTLLVFFSGAKGYHVGLPIMLAGSPEPSAEFHKIARRFAEGVAERLAVTIDAGVYDRVRAFRAPNSRHPKTGLHKRWLSFDELLGLSVDAILRLAATPEPFAPGADADGSPVAIADWREATEAVERDTAALAERRLVNPQAKLNRLTRDFIRDGAASGDRHRLLFSAAANLAEFGCPPALAHELLTEAALDSGLSPSEVRRQIDCGLAAVSPNEGGTA
ncbi:MAG: DNA primase [Bythopirellula sp.]|nr:DNA primase [Bythopirellula sp.]